MAIYSHAHFISEKGWLNKGMKYVNFKPDVFVDKEEIRWMYWELVQIW